MQCYVIGMYWNGKKLKFFVGLQLQLWWPKYGIHSYEKCPKWNDLHCPWINSMPWNQILAIILGSNSELKKNASYFFVEKKNTHLNVFSVNFPIAMDAMIWRMSASQPH